MVARKITSLVGVEAIPGDFVAYRVTSSLDSFLSKSYVEPGEPLSSPVEQKVMPQKYGSYISSNLQLNRSTRLHSTCPHFNHGYHFLMRVEVLRQMPK